jgi:formylglycine-generating enzyme
MLPLVLLALVAFAGTFAATRWWRSSEEPQPPRENIRTQGGDQPLPENTALQSTPPGMIWIPGGEFTMGTDDPNAWPDEKPAHRVRVDGFWMDKTEVTNARFRKFVEATGYVTTAERKPDWKELKKQLPPGTPKPPDEKLVPGSLVFTMTKQPVRLNDISQWWKWTPGASWRCPEGPGSDLKGRENHPVVQVSWDDAVAYCKWAGKRLPTEAEWEFAARGGLDRKPFTWGDDRGASGKYANIWEGDFPYRNTAEDGYIRTAPAGSFKPNGYGLYDMAGNVWEWCSDWYRRDLYRLRAGKGTVENPRGPAKSFDPTRPYQPQRSQRGGSFLCNDSYCSRYRPSARHGCTPDTGMSHVGFRCVMTPAK